MSTRFKRVAAFTTALLLGSITAGACGSGTVTMSGESDNVSNDITGSVKEWEVELSAYKAEAGSVTFTIANEGTIEHEFLVVKTDISLGKIPVVDGRFPEDAEGIEVIDEIPEYAEGTTETLTVTLEPGKYQLVCNIESHYEAGMFASFEVR